MKESKTNWELVVSIIALVIGFFGWNAANCLGCVSCSGDDDSSGTTSSVVSEPDDVESIPTESEIQAEIEQKSGKRYIENVKVLCTSDYGINYEYSDSAIANTGDYHSHSLIVNCSMFYGKEESMELYLNKEYTEFYSTVALSDAERDLISPHKITIFCDGEAVWSKKYKAGTLPENLYLDVSDVIVLKIVIRNCDTGGSSRSEFIFGDAYFTLAESE